MIVPMGHTLTFHFVDPEIGRRSEAAQLFSALGHRAEVYADIGELLRHPPDEGVIVAHEGAADRRAPGILDLLEDADIALPLIVASESPDPRRVVEAISAGTFDYMVLPFDEGSLASLVARAVRQSAEHGKARRKKLDARLLLDALSNREREVLALLVDGASNKLIARMLAISPRTVEIHRANMMAKLGVSHAAGAVRLFLEAELATGGGDG